jgi:hypothetical protein
MHELPCDPPDYGCSEGPPLVPCRPTVKHRSHSLQRKAYICELAELGSVASFDPTYLVIVAVAPFVCQIAVSALFEPSVRAQTVSLPAETTAYVAAVTPLLDNEQGEHAAVDGRRALPWRGLPCC